MRLQLCPMADEDPASLRRADTKLVPVRVGMSLAEAEKILITAMLKQYGGECLYRGGG